MNIDISKLITATAKEEDAQAKAVAAARAQAIAYLADTDWYVIRNSETGAAIPDDVITARTAARLTASEG